MNLRTDPTDLDLEEADMGELDAVGEWTGIMCMIPSPF